MLRIEEIFEQTESFDEIPDENLNQFAVEIVALLQEETQLQWLCANLSRLNELSLLVIKIIALQARLPEPLLREIRDLQKSGQSRKWLNVSYNTILAYQGEEAFLEELGRILLADLKIDEKQYSHTVLAETIAVVHSDRALAILNEYANLTQYDDCREFVLNLIDRWDSLTPENLGW